MLADQRIDLDELTALSMQCPCPQGTVEYSVWLRGCIRGANNQQQDAPASDHVPAYHEGWAVGQQWYRENAYEYGYTVTARGESKTVVLGKCGTEAYEAKAAEIAAANRIDNDSTTQWFIREAADHVS